MSSGISVKLLPGSCTVTCTTVCAKPVALDEAVMSFATVSVVVKPLLNFTSTLVSVPSAGLNCGNVRLPVQSVGVEEIGVDVVVGPMVAALAHTDETTASTVAVRIRRRDVIVVIRGPPAGAFASCSAWRPDEISTSRYRQSQVPYFQPPKHTVDKMIYSQGSLQRGTIHYKFDLELPCVKTAVIRYTIRPKSTTGTLNLRRSIFTVSVTAQIWFVGGQSCLPPERRLQRGFAAPQKPHTV